VFLCFAAAYLLSYAFRSINAVIAPALLSELGLSKADLGLLSSAYLLSFAALQLPVGIWLDKYGPRKTEATLLLFAAAGAAIFACSTTLLGLWVGRALIGAGVSACLMAPFKAYRRGFAPERQSQLASWMLVAGTSGALAATVPVTAAMTVVGWRGVFWVMAGLILLAAVAILLLLKEVECVNPPQPASHSANLATAPGFREGYGRIFGHALFRRMALLGMVNQGSFIALQTLWAGPWMTTVLKMSPSLASRTLFVFNFSMLLAYVALGWWAPRHVVEDGRPGLTMSQVVRRGLFGTLLAQGAILTVTAPWAWILWIVFACCATVTTLLQARINLTFPEALTGRANSIYNLVLFIGAFGVQWGVGVVIDAAARRGASPTLAMQIAFGLFLVLQAAALSVFAASGKIDRPVTD
jgi:MFS family permease